MKFANDDLLKFKFETPLADLSVDGIAKFIDDFKNGNLKPFLKSEPIPEDNNGPVKTLVGGNWNDIVADPTKDVLVKYYAPWCGHCKSLAPIWTELGQFVEGLDDVVIAKMDSTANEVTGVSVRSYPTLIWYPKDNKSGIAYSAGRELADFKEFLSTNSESYKNFTNQQEGEAAEVKEDL